jgi:hypothetical protein
MKQATRRRTKAKGIEAGDVIRLRGCLELEMRVALAGHPDDGKVVAYRKQENTIVTVGRKWVLEKICSFSNQTNSINAVALGTSTTAPATSDTALGSEITATVGRLTIGTWQTGNLTSNPPSARAEVSFGTAQAVGTLGEIGLWNTSAATAGTMLGRVTFSTISKSTSNSLTVSYTISN